VLVTGGAGFIGSNFVRYILAEDQEVRVINLDLLTYAGSRENLKGLPGADRHTFIQGDILDRQLVLSMLADYQIDTIVHFAAESHVDRSILGPAPFVDTNIVGTFNLLECVREVWLQGKGGFKEGFRFHHISTDEVFGSLGPEDPSFSEASPYAPNSPYAASKAASDHLVRAYGHTYDLPYTITNCSNNYGPYQFPEKLIPLMLFNAQAGKQLPLYGDGGQIRDWLFVEDHCEAIHLVLEEGERGETYIVGGDNQLPNLEVVELLCEILDDRLTGSPHRPHRELITFIEDRPGHDRRYAMDISRIRSELGWEPKATLASGLRKTVDWYLGHLDWVGKIRSRPGYQEWLERNYANREERV
jgi:dTDP-glucose 4,6-dehydratase